MSQQTLSVSNAQDRARAHRKDSGGARRNQLLTAAAECFDEVGLGAATVEMISDAFSGHVLRRTVRQYANYLKSVDPDLIDPAVEPERLVQMLADAMHHGAKRLANGTAEEKERFILDQIHITERLVGIKADVRGAP